MRMLPLVKSRASCPRRQTGAIITDGKHRLISTGYNGPPSGLDNCTEVPCPGADDVTGDTRFCIALHAEHNAIYFAGDRRESAHTLYCTTQPCTKCCLEILQTPIKRVLYLEEYPDKQGIGLLHHANVMANLYLYHDIKEEDGIITIG